MPAAEQLERILYVLPVAARNGGATFEELARALDTDVKTIMRDLQQATSRVFYHPAGNVDPFEISIWRGRVYVHAPTEFNRPVRLSDREALALGLGLRVLAAEADVQRREEILALADRLEEELAAPDLVLRPASISVQEVMADYEPLLHVSVGEDDVRGVLAEAIETGRACVIEYLKPQSVPAERVIVPHQLMYANGQWYVAAHDVAANETRNFRLDRILRASLTDEQLDFDDAVESSAAVFGSDSHEIEADVRYSPRVARWIAEQTGESCEADGSIVVRHRVADVNWLVRHVLMYGGEAVVETPSLRTLVASAAARLSA